MEDQQMIIIKEEAISLYKLERETEELAVDLKNELERETARIKEMEVIVKRLESDNERRTRDMELSKNHRAQMSTGITEIHNIFKKIGPHIQEIKLQAAESKKYENMFSEQHKHNEIEIKKYDGLLKQKIKEKLILTEQTKLDMTKEQEANKESLKELDDKLESLTVEDNKLKSNMEVISNDDENIRKEIDEETLKQNELNTQNSNIKMEIEEKEFKLQEIRHELNNFENIFETEKNNLIAKNEETHRRISEVESAIKMNQLEVEENTSEICKLDEKAVELEKLWQVLQMNITTDEQKLQKLKQKITKDEETFEKEFSDLSKKLDEQNILLNEGQRKFDEDEEIIKGLKDEGEMKLLEQQKGIDNYEEAKIIKLKLSSEIKFIEAKMKTLTNTIEELSRSIKENDDKISQLEKKTSEDLELIQSDEEKLKRSVDELQAEVEALQIDLDQFEQGTEKERMIVEEGLTKENDNLIQRISDLKLQRENLSNVRKGKETKLQGLKLEGNVLSRKVHALQEKRRLAIAAERNKKRKVTETVNSVPIITVAELFKRKRDKKAKKV